MDAKKSLSNKNCIFNFNLRPYEQNILIFFIKFLEYHMILIYYLLILVRLSFHEFLCKNEEYNQIIVPQVHCIKFNEILDEISIVSC